MSSPADGSGPVLEARAIEKSYTQGATVLPILRGASISVGRGEIVAVTGPSGSGKSTLLHVLGALDPPDAGSVVLEGRNVWSVSERERAVIRNTKLGFVFQFHHLLAEFTLLENVALPAMFAGTGRVESLERASELVRAVGLEARSGHFPSQISGGERQRAAVARALVCGPAVVLADEPTGNLDSASSAALRDLIWGLAGDLDQSFVLATHNLELAGKADRELKLREGLLS